MAFISMSDVTPKREPTSKKSTDKFIAKLKVKLGREAVAAKEDAEAFPEPELPKEVKE